MIEPEDFKCLSVVDHSILNVFFVLIISWTEAQIFSKEDE